MWYCFLLLLRDTNHITGFRLGAFNDPGFPQCLDCPSDGLVAHTSHVLGKPDRLEPLSRVRFRVVQMRTDVPHGLVRVLFKVPDAAVDALEHGRQPLIGRVARDDLPRAPRGVDLADALDLPVVVVLFGREVLPHEEVGRAVVDAVAELGERLQRHDLEGRRRVARGRQPPFRVGEHEAHHVGPAAPARQPILSLPIP